VRRLQSFDCKITLAVEVKLICDVVGIQTNGCDSSLIYLTEIRWSSRNDDRRELMHRIKKSQFLRFGMRCSPRDRR